MPVKKMFNKGEVPVKVFTNDIDHLAMQQLINISQLPIIHSHVAAMPDVHVGRGATVGSVIPTYKAIIPAAVGVDIGCGMNAVRLSLKAKDLPDNLRKVRMEIEAAVPVGFEMHKVDRARDSTIRALSTGLHDVLARSPKVLSGQKRSHQTWIRQLGSLGGGNHFIEICVDENEDVWVMLHSGSRGVGNTMGQYFINLAKKDALRNNLRLPDKDLAYFEEGAEHFEQYVQAVNWAQDYAMANRREMMYLIVKVLKKQFPDFHLTKEAINCHHNYVTKENHFDASVYVTRKGAISAREGELGIIPGSMGARSYIVRGLGNKESFCSCAHGAGRRMSRTAARKKFLRADMEQQTKGIECRKDSGVIDEIPAAYKDIDEVMENQNDLVEIVHTLHQVVCIKG
ncbi:RNA-2',3'-PO4:RNA-5'-OH ligase [hydrothermal vent metagenome]|uniref:3'-phosphate/5'-hydroxy nucleic acid ligase n=1 Tax=hydrothermal vent metagenome TaxID=652676 RepID=A0A3B0XZC7_9ZZZZ